MKFLLQLFVPSIDKALNVLNRALAGLEKVAEYHENQAFKHSSAIYAAQLLKNQHEIQAQRATTVANRLAALLDH